MLTPLGTIMNQYITILLATVIITSTGFLSSAYGQAAEEVTQQETLARQGKPGMLMDQDKGVFMHKENTPKNANTIHRPRERPEVLIVGGGASHDFERWFNLEDSKILADAGANVRYTDEVEYIKELLPEVDILYLCNNQPLPDPSLREAIFDFVESGKDLMIVHAAVWYNWDDWPEYNRELVGGGSRGHDEFGTFEVEVVNTEHPVLDNVPASFQITDELYYFEKDRDGSDIEVLAKGIEPGTGKEFPVVWTVEYGKGQIAGITLGHDDKAHEHPAYINILQNSLSWFQQN